MGRQGPVLKMKVMNEVIWVIVGKKPDQAFPCLISSKKRLSVREDEVR